MKTISLKLPDKLLSRVDRTSRRRRVPRSQVVREALERFVAGESAEPARSFADVTSDLRGCVEGPGDLSTNPAHMAGYGR